ncbi:hypothetical protein ACEV60_27540 [Enterobacter ludwigii]|uniref:hypothetical protein n=1 Tax=Enterobacter TaxID=547 RepID=UPI003BEEE9F0
MSMTKMMWCLVLLLILAMMGCVAALEAGSISRYIALNAMERAISAFYPEIKKAANVSVVLASYRVDSSRGPHFMHIDAVADVRFREGDTVVCRRIQVRDVGEFEPIPDEASTISGCD